MLELATQTANELGHEPIGTEHLLLALLRDEFYAGALLHDLGLDFDASREEVLRRRPPAGAVLEPQRRPGVHPGRIPDSLEVVDRAGNVRARLTGTRSGQPGMIFYDDAGRERLVVKLDADGAPRLEMLDAEGKVTFKAP